MTASIRLIEEISINAWPSPQTLVYDGWVIRFAEGYTRRANSINPLYPSTQRLADKVQYCETLFRNQGLPPVFKLTDASEPSELDSLLDSLGYVTDALTGVRLLNLNGWRGRVESKVQLTEALTPQWFTGYWRTSGNPAKHESAARQILSNILPGHVFASINVEDQLVAFGLGVLQNGYFGLYDIVTVPAYRRQGLGRTIVEALISWAWAHSAHTAYLQVMLNNPPALALYEQIGFQPAYHYWYRQPHAN